MSGDSRMNIKLGRMGKTRLRISNFTKISPSPCQLDSCVIAEEIPSFTADLIGPSHNC